MYMVEVVAREWLRRYLSGEKNILRKVSCTYLKLVQLFEAALVWAKLSENNSKLEQLFRDLSKSSSDQDTYENNLRKFALLPAKESAMLKPGNSCFELLANVYETFEVS